MAPELGYWNIRGLAQPIRILLAYKEIPFVEKKYDFGPAPDYDRSAWLNEKNSLGLDFPNLPYYIDGDVKISQSVAIMRYLARKLNLEGETDDEKRRADVIEQQMCDIRMKFYMLCYNPEFEKVKEEYLKNLPDIMKSVSSFLGKRQWFASHDKLTYVDFMIHEVLDNHRTLAPNCLNDFQNLKGFMERFEEVPTIRKYMQSPDFIEFPICGDMAVYGSRGSKN